MMGFADDMIATAYRDEMRKQHEATGATVIDWPHATGWTAGVDGDEIVVRDPSGTREWRFPR